MRFRFGVWLEHCSMLTIPFGLGLFMIAVGWWGLRLEWWIGAPVVAGLVAVFAWLQARLYRAACAYEDILGWDRRRRK